MSKSNKGAIRKLSDEVTSTLLPALESIGFEPHSTSTANGSWNGAAYVWHYARKETESLETHLEVVASGGKSQALNIYGRTFLDVSSSASDAKPIEQRYLRSIASYPLSILTTVSERPNAEIRLIRLRKGAPQFAQFAFKAIEFVGIWVLRFANYLAVLGLLAVYVPVKGLRSVTTDSDAIKNGSRQRKIVENSARDMKEIFGKGLPKFLARDVIELS